MSEKGRMEDLQLHNIYFLNETKTKTVLLFQNTFEKVHALGLAYEINIISEIVMVMVEIFERGILV